MFTQNQVRQLYVANAYKAAASGLTNAGDINVGTQENDVFFNFVNADGVKMRTDAINMGKIKSVTFTPAGAMEYKTKATYIKLSPDALSDGKPVAGEDYILNIKINQLNWHSDEAYGWKYGVVHSTSNMTEADFYKTLAKSLAANLSRDPEQLLKVYITSATGATAIASGNCTLIEKDSDTDAIASGNCKAIVIDEAEQAWKLGTLSQEPVYYEAKSDEIIVNNDETKWGVETVTTGLTTIDNGKKIADMEWFYHGERGDIYREGAWRNNWPNKMLVNEANTYGTLDIHYYWDGANHAVQKSEKDITIAMLPAASGVVAAFTAAISGSVDASSVTYAATGTPKTVIVE